MWLLRACAHLLLLPWAGATVWQDDYRKIVGLLSTQTGFWFKRSHAHRAALLVSHIVASACASQGVQPPLGYNYLSRAPPHPLAWVRPRTHIAAAIVAEVRETGVTGDRCA